MILSDLMKPYENKYGLENDKLIKSNRVIALDGKDGKKLFDTRFNKAEYIEEFMSGEVIAIWASTKEMFEDNGYGGTIFQPCIMMCLSHDSWKSN